MNLETFLSEVINELIIPQFLYHATYKSLLDSIKKNGLNSNIGKKTYPDSKRGVIYLARNKDIALSYAETSDIVPEDWLNEIIMLKINTKNLNKNSFILDSNVIENEGHTLEYHGNIDYKNIQVSK